MSRLFTFGCSMTKYFWPTWADILSKNYEHYENWGHPGAGNLYISNSVCEAHLRNKFTEDDTVVILWSGITRTDYHKEGTWRHLGPEFEFTNTDLEGYELINFGYIFYTMCFLESIGVKYKMFSFGELMDEKSASKTQMLFLETLSKIKTIKYNNYGKEVLLNIKGIQSTYLYNLLEDAYNTFKGSDWPDFALYIDNQQEFTKEVLKEINHVLRKSINASLKDGMHIHIKRDWHPKPSEHLSMLTQMFPELPITDEMKQFVEEWDEKIKHNGFDPFLSPKISTN